MAVSINGTNGITFNDGTSFSSAEGLGMRNRLINGAMAVDQRNAGASHTLTAGSNVYGVDRWFTLATGANATGQRVTGAATNTYRYQITGAASISALTFVQRIEAINSADLAGKTVTLSFDMANSLLTTVRVRLSYAGGTDNWALTTTDFLDTNVTITSTVTRYSVSVAVPAAATTGIQVLFSVGAQTSGTWTIGNAQLEVGNAASPMERRPIGTELALCQRYYWASSTDHTYGSPGSTYQSSYTATNPVTMRSLATYTFGTPTANTGVSSASIAAVDATTYKVFLQASVAGNARYAAPFTASIEL
jgi:hypothetical protein